MKTFFLFCTCLMLACGVTATQARTRYTPQCALRASVIRGPNITGQYLLYMQIPETCAAMGRHARIITSLGATLPPLGYFRLGDGAPLAVKYWVWPGATVQDNTAPGQWKTVRAAGWP